MSRVTLHRIERGQFFQHFGRGHGVAEQHVFERGVGGLALLMVHR